MKDRLKNFLIDRLALENKDAELVSTKVFDWIKDEDRIVTCVVHTSEKMVISKLEGSNTLILSITDSTNVAGAAIVQPNAKSYFVEFSLNGSD
jgi:hypothetical protein